MDFDEMKDKAQDFAGSHPDQVNQGLDKVGDAAKEKFGHGEQIDQGLDKARDFLGGGGQGGDQQQQ
jgi:hypothetical protein